MQNATDMQIDAGRRKRIRRNVLLLALFAAAIYAGFIVAFVSRH
jgi:hypothetical protein